MTAPLAARPVRGRRPVQAAVVLALLAAGVGAYRFLASLKEPPARVARETERVVVSVVRASPRPYQVWVEGYGRVRSLRRATVSAEVQGHVLWVSPRLEAGASLEAEEVVVRIDDAEAAQRVREAEAELERRLNVERQRQRDIQGWSERLDAARHELDVARRELERAEKLVEAGDLEETQRDQRERAVASLERVVADLSNRVESTRIQLEGDRAGVTQAQAQAEQARLQLERTRVRAPWDGRVVARSVSPGSWVSPGTALFEIVDPFHVEVPVPLPASSWGDVSAGAEAIVRRRRDGEPIWRGKVARVAPLVDPDTRSFEVFLRLDGSGEKPVVPPGAFVSCAVAGRRYDDVFVIPRVAFVNDEVYVVEPESDGDPSQGVARRRRPRVLRLLPDVALAAGGIEKGELVVATHLEKVSEGTRVIVGGELSSEELHFEGPVGTEGRQR